MERFTPEEQARYYPQWVNTGAKDKNGHDIGVTVKSAEEHISKYPESFEEFVESLTPVPKSEEEMYAAVLTERKECVKFIRAYPTGKVLAGEIAAALEKSRIEAGRTVKVEEPKKRTGKGKATTDPDSAGAEEPGQEAADKAS